MASQGSSVQSIKPSDHLYFIAVSIRIAGFREFLVRDEGVNVALGQGALV